MRIRFYVLVLALLGFLAAPLAEAQTNPQVKFFMESAHDSMPLPETGKRSHSITVKAKVKDFACSQKAVYNVDTVLKPDFPKWAGASLNPRSVKLTINQGQPGTTEATLDGQFITLEVAWDLDGRPKKDARWTYEITFDEKSGKLDSGGPCAPTPVMVYEPTPIKVTASMPDIVENASAVPSDCSTAPDLPECQTGPPTEEGGKSPGFDATMFILAAAGLVVVLRRRR